MELFQDEDKVTSPTGSGPPPGGRTRLSIKPDKGKPDQASKEHKKTVGLQVGHRIIIIIIIIFIIIIIIIIIMIIIMMMVIMIIMIINNDDD